MDSKYSCNCNGGDDDRAVRKLELVAVIFYGDVFLRCALE